MFRKDRVYYFKKMIPFDSVTLEDMTNVKGVANVFALVPDELFVERDPKVLKKKRKKMQLLFGCISENEKASWMKDIGDAINVRKLMKELGHH